jgi:hypothetical protein
VVTGKLDVHHLALARGSGSVDAGPLDSGVAFDDDELGREGGEELVEQDAID